MSTGVLSRNRPAPELEVMDPRLRARRIEVERDRGRRRLRRLVALAVVTAVVVLGIAVARSPLLDVDTVVVDDARATGDDVVRRAAGIERGRAMTSVDLGAAEARVEDLPWIAAATVTREWPGTVRVQVTERTAVAVAGRGSAAVLVDRDARILGPAGDVDDLPVASRAVPGEPGERLAADDRPVVALLARLPDDLLAQVDRGRVDGEGLGLVLRDGIEVHLGDGTRVRAKSAAVLVLLEQADRPTIATIDVSVPGPAALTRTPSEGA